MILLGVSLSLSESTPWLTLQTYFTVFFYKNEIPSNTATGILASQPVLDEEYSITTFPAPAAEVEGTDPQPPVGDVGVGATTVPPMYQANARPVTQIQQDNIVVAPDPFGVASDPVVPPFVRQHAGSAVSIVPQSFPSHPPSSQGIEASSSAVSDDATPPPYHIKN